MTRFFRRRIRGSSRGQALVETSLTLSIMLILSLATFDLGRGIAAHLALTEATQEGALYAAHRRYSTSPAPNAAVTNSEVQTRVRTSSNAEAVCGTNPTCSNGATVTVTCVKVPSHRVIVTSTYPLPTISPIGNLLFGGSFTLTVDATAPIIRGACP